MAEVLGAAAASIQLLGCIKQIHQFCKDFHDIPEDLHAIITELKLLEPFFAGLQSLEEIDPGTSTIALLKNSLSYCQNSANILEAAATTAAEPLKNGRRNTAHRIKIILRKGDLKKLREQLKSAKDNLHLAISYHQMIELKRHTDLLNNLNEQLLPSGSAIPKIISAAESNQIALNNSAVLHNKKLQRRLFSQQRSVVKEDACTSGKCCCSCHDVSSIGGRFWFCKVPVLSYGHSACTSSSCVVARKTFFWMSFSQFGIPWALNVNLGIIWNSRAASISPSLRFERVVKYTSPGFELLWRLETNQTNWPKAKQELLDIFAPQHGSPAASPRDIDPSGQTWLEKLLSHPWNGAIGTQFELMAMLVEMGTQINTSGLLIQAANWIGEGPHMALINRLLQHNFDPSVIEAPQFAHWPQPCSPNWISEEMTPDPFFVDWIAENLKVCPGFAGMNPLLEAILLESNERIQDLLEKYPIDDQDNLLGQSALHLAVFRPHHLQLVLESGSDVDAKDRHGITPLMYASAVGNTDMVIQLIDAGASPIINDSLRKRNFLAYASARGHWDTILNVLDYIRGFHELPKDSANLWLTLGLILRMANKISCPERRLGDIRMLLEMGADPNFAFESKPHQLNEQIIHHVQGEDEFRILVSHGFSGFNHQDSAGAHPLIIFAEQRDPQLLQICLDGGSAVNHQDENGFTALHTICKHFRSPIHVNSITQDTMDCKRKSSTRACVDLLLRHCADPLLGDNCTCGCSENGCTPIHFLLKEQRVRYSNYGDDIWVMEMLDLVRKHKGPDVLRSCVESMLRIIRFEELGLTHTCCSESFLRINLSRRLDHDEISEIIDEEKELMKELRKVLAGLENSSEREREQSLIQGISELGMRAKSENQEYQKRFSLKENSTKHPAYSYKIDYKKDTLFCNFDCSTSRMVVDTIGLDGYNKWVEYENSNCGQDAKLYEKRKAWIAEFRALENNNVGISD